MFPRSDGFYEIQYIQRQMIYSLTKHIMTNETLQDYEEIVEERDNIVDLATVMKGDCPNCGNPM